MLKVEREMSNAETVFSVENLSVAYHDDPVLTSVNLTVPNGVVMGVVGPNGAGKSTLLKASLGLIPKLTGTVQFFGQELDLVRTRVGYVPQSSSVDWDFPTTVFDVVLMGTYGKLGWLRSPGKPERAAVAAALLETGISELADRQIGQLSGGQKQRVFLARALAQQSELYFMDEPFQGIDAKSQEEIVRVLRNLKNQGKTIIMVHHDLTTVLDYCDWVTLINRGVIATGPAKETFNRENIRTTYEVGSSQDFLEFLSK